MSRWNNWRRKGVHADARDDGESGNFDPYNFSEKTVEVTSFQMFHQISSMLETMVLLLCPHKTADKTPMHIVASDTAPVT